MSDSVAILQHKVIEFLKGLLQVGRRPGCQNRCIFSTNFREQKETLYIGKGW